jgi:hypothetical protein
MMNRSLASRPQLMDAIDSPGQLGLDEYVHCISITGGKWISLRNGFGHEVGGPFEAIIFPRRHKV